VFAPPYETAFDSCGAVLDKKALSESEPQFQIIILPDLIFTQPMIPNTAGLFKHAVYYIHYIETGYHPKTVREVYLEALP